MLDVLVGRVRSAVLAAWGGFIGLLPHVLHHVGRSPVPPSWPGPRARSSSPRLGWSPPSRFCCACTGASAPGGLRRSRSPSLTVMFSLSSFVIGPAISGGEDTSPRPEIEDADHQEHH